MKILKIISIFIFLILVSNTASALDAVTNITVEPDVDHAHLEWDAVLYADGYNLSLPLPSIYRINDSDAPTIDGIIDTDVVNLSQHGILPTPNPVNTLDYDIIYAVSDSTYFYMAADTIDNDIVTVDDSIEVAFDFAQDGLTTDDLKYVITEAGVFFRQKWTGTTWTNYPGSSANVVTSGKGTSHVVYELQFPISEFPSFVFGDYIDLTVMRQNTNTATVQSYFPSSAFSTFNVSGWQTMFIANDTEFVPALTLSTENNYYNLTSLDDYSWYEVEIVAYNNTSESLPAYIEFITLDTPKYNISGYVLDSDTGLGLSCSLITITDTFAHGFAESNESGYYILTGLHNDSYILYASCGGYVSDGLDVVVAGINLTNQNITLDYITDAEIREKSYADGFMLIGGILITGLFISLAFVVYNAGIGKVRISQKQLRELGFVAVFIVIFLMAVVLMAGLVYR